MHRTIKQGLLVVGLAVVANGFAATEATVPAQEVKQEAAKVVEAPKPAEKKTDAAKETKAVEVKAEAAKVEAPKAAAKVAAPVQK